MRSEIELHRPLSSFPRKRESRFFRAAGPRFRGGDDWVSGSNDVLPLLPPRLLDERGYIHQVTDAAALDALAEKQVVTGYIGFDATAPSLHVGSLVQIMLLRRLQQAGHKPIVLMGGGTTKVGDPSGKDESRKLLTDEQIDANIACDPPRASSTS